MRHLTFVRGQIQINITRIIKHCLKMLSSGCLPRFTFGFTSICSSEVSCICIFLFSNFLSQSFCFNCTLHLNLPFPGYFNQSQFTNYFHHSPYAVVNYFLLDLFQIYPLQVLFEISVLKILPLFILILLFYR